MKASDRVYLGDSVYLHYDGFAFTIYLDNGDGAKNSIWLEPEVALALLRKIQETLQPAKAE